MDQTYYTWLGGPICIRSKSSAAYFLHTHDIWGSRMDTLINDAGNMAFLIQVKSFNSITVMLFCCRSCHKMSLCFFQTKNLSLQIVDASECFRFWHNDRKCLMMRSMAKSLANRPFFLKVHKGFVCLFMW